MSTNKKITVEEVLEIIELRNYNYQNKEISEKLNISTGLISMVTRAYNGNESQLLKIGKYNRNIVAEAMNKDKQKYEVKILFGLITLKITPVVG